MPGAVAVHAKAWCTSDERGMGSNPCPGIVVRLFSHPALGVVISGWDTEVTVSQCWSDSWSMVNRKRRYGFFCLVYIGTT